MAGANIYITLQGGEMDGQWLRFAPGDTLRGSVQVVPDSDVRANHVWIRLQWHTEGKADRDLGRVAEQDIFQGQLTAQMPVQASFSFSLPQAPWSYAGHYINIIWEVLVEIDVPLAPDLRKGQMFILAPHGLVRPPEAMTAPPTSLR